MGTWKLALSLACFELARLREALLSPGSLSLACFEHTGDMAMGNQVSLLVLLVLNQHTPSRGGLPGLLVLLVLN